jgi:hypothetical protein
VLKYIPFDSKKKKKKKKIAVNSSFESTASSASLVSSPLTNDTAGWLFLMVEQEQRVHFQGIQDSRLASAV